MSWAVPGGVVTTYDSGAKSETTWTQMPNLGLNYGHGQFMSFFEHIYVYIYIYTYNNNYIYRSFKLQLNWSSIPCLLVHLSPTKMLPTW